MDENDRSFYRNVDLKTTTDQNEEEEEEEEEEDEEEGGGQALNFKEDGANEVIEIPDDDETAGASGTQKPSSTSAQSSDTWTLPSIRGVLKGADLEEEEREAEEEQEEKEVEREKISHERGITMKQTKDGKRLLIFSGEQKDMAKVIADKLRTKFEQSKQTELCDFKVN